MLPSLRDIYSNRTATAWANLGDTHFEAYAAQGQGDALRYVGGGCLDAPDQLPAGCTRTYGEGQGAHAMAVLCPRPDLLGSPQGLDAALNEAITALRLARQREASTRGQHTLQRTAAARTCEPHLPS